MDVISISQLKANPSKAISQSGDYPVAVKKRNKIKAYLLGKELYEKLVAYIEDFIDKKTIEETNFTKGKDFGEVTKELGV